MTDLEHHLQHGPLYRFADWPNPEVPLVAAGVYTIWEGDWFLYVGMAGRALTAEDIATLRARGEKRKGLAERLNSHASGRRSGDQFCVYVCAAPRLSQGRTQLLFNRRVVIGTPTQAQKPAYFPYPHQTIQSSTN